MSKKRKILITGSGGFIFGNFIRQVFFHKKPYFISSLDKVRESHIIQNIYINTDHSFYIADILDKHILRVIFEKEKPEIVIHGAAETSSSLVSNNIIGTQNIIDECIRSNSKLIYVSSDNVYGSVDNEKCCDEKCSINPRTLYASSKASGELLVKSASEINNLKYNIIRLCNNYGPWQTSDKLIPKIIKSIINNEDITIYGKGNNVRNWIHVYDTCSALFNIIDNDINKEIYNITSKQEFNNLEVAQLVCNAFGKGHNLIKHVEDNANNDFRHSISNDKLKSLGWSYQYKLKDGLAQTCQWYVSNKYILNM